MLHCQVQGEDPAKHMNPILSLRNISKSFRQGDSTLAVLRDVSLDIGAGESVALAGPSGCGKSTLLQIAGLLEGPTAGEVFIAGENAGKLSDHKKTMLRRGKIGFVYQFHHLLPEFSALENVALPQMIAGITRSKAKEKSAYLLDKLGLTKRLEHRPSEMSGGEQQRVAIARALANDPAILLADEPTGNLDPHSAENVFAVFLAAVKEFGLATLLVTHNAELAARLDKTITLKEGEVISL